MVIVRPGEPRGAAAVAVIFDQGVEDRVATFETVPVPASEWARRLTSQDALILVAERRGLYKLVGKIFTTNETSIALVRACGFREIGVHRRHGRLDGSGRTWWSWSGFSATPGTREMIRAGR
jgi:L-amino acid N-acyltransferase YncA